MAQTPEEMAQAINDKIEAIKTQNRDFGEKINTLSLRIKVVEHDLKNMTEALPPQLLQRKRSDKSA